MTLMEYLIKTGSERVAQQCRENIYAVQTLKDFQYIDRDGKDQVHKHSRVLRAPCIYKTECLASGNTGTLKETQKAYLLLLNQAQMVCGVWVFAFYIRIYIN